MNIIYFLLFSTLGIYIIIAIAKDLRKADKKGDQEVAALDLTYEEYNKALNFMLAYGIIDSQDYNKILSKGLPYTH